MSYFGYIDFDRPVDFEAGRIYHSYGNDAFLLTPSQCSVMSADDGGVNFRLDLVRGNTPGDRHYAMLEMRLSADYPIDRALAFLRGEHPNAVLTNCALTGWEFRLAPGPATAELPEEMRDGAQLASNGLGTARLIMPLSIESGLLIESMIRDGRSAFPAVATAWLEGVSPRVAAVVRFRASDLLSELEDVLDGDRTMSRLELERYFHRGVTSLPMEVTGSVTPDRLGAFAEAMADRVIDRFGSYAPFDADTSEPSIRIQRLPEDEETDLIWSLSEPFLTSRHTILTFDLLADIRHKIQDDVVGAYAVFHTAPAMPSFGQSTVTVYCNLPTERIGVAALGATLTFPPNPPNRPQEQVVTVEFGPPDDVAKAQVRLAPGEPLTYRYSTFAVVNDEHGVRQMDGPERAGGGATLQLSPDDFPLDFALVEVGADLTQQASVHGACLYERDGSEHLIPFRLDGGRRSASIALPKDRSSVNIHCSATALQGTSVLHLGPFDALHVRLYLSSFPEYGMHEVEIACELDDRTSLYAIDLLADGDPETPDALSVLAFTREHPTRRYRWFARSPFRPGFRYRPHRDGDVQASWTHVPRAVQHLAIHPEAAQPRDAIGVMARSEHSMRVLRAGRNGRHSETSRPVQELTPALPEAGMLPRSPEPEPTDLMVFSDPANPSRRYYIPQYSLGVQTVSGRQEYRVAMAQTAAGSSLTVHLRGGPAPQVIDAAPDAEPLSHEVGVRLEFLSSPPYTARKILEFEDVTRNGLDVRAKMLFASLEERDEVYRALTDGDRDARLVVKRGVDVALPQVASTAPPGTIDPSLFEPLLPVRPKPPWIFELPVQPDPPQVLKPMGILDEPRNVTLVDAVVTKPAQVNLNPVMLQPAFATSVNLAGRSESAALELRVKDIAVTRFPGKIVINDWPVFEPVPSLPTPQLTFTGREEGGTFVRCKLSVTNWSEFSAEYFQASPDLPPCGRNTQASRTWIDIFDATTNARLYGFCAISDPSNLADLWFAAAPDQVPARVYVQMVDRRAQVTRTSNVVETTVPKPVHPIWVAAHRELDHPVAPTPFTFVPSLHGYMFRGIQPGSGESRLVRYRLPWLGSFHTYLQDASRPEVVYFFPDSFRIARRREPPFTPYITVRVSGQVGGADADVVFDYIVASHTNPDRLTAARSALIANQGFDASNVQFQPFVTNDVRFSIDRPTQQGTMHEERADVALVLQGAMKDTLVMKLPDFQLIFDAMHRDTASLFLGKVEFDVPGETTEEIPFSARMTELEGDLFVFSANANASGGVDVVLANAIESPVRIDALPATMTRNGVTVSARSEGLTLPVASLAPKETLQFSLIPATPLGGSGAFDVAFNLDAVTVLPDPTLILDSILDRTTLQYFDIITVKVIASLFQPVEGRPQDQIVVILVVFEGGGTAELNASTLETQVRIDYPIDDVILRRTVNTSYRYTVTVIRADGRQDRDPTPRQGTARTLYVAISK